MKLPSLPATLLMSTLALSPQVHADETPTTQPPEGGPKTEQTVIVKAPSGRESMQALAAQHGLVLADAGTSGKVIRHTKKGTDAAASLVSGYVNSSVQHGRAADAHDRAAAEAGREATQIVRHAKQTLEGGAKLNADDFLKEFTGG